MLVRPWGREINTPVGNGKQFIIRHLRAGFPTLEQIFTIFPDKPWILIALMAQSDTPISSNWMSPLWFNKESKSKGIQFSGSSRIIEAPFDNDNWRWIKARLLDGSEVAGSSHEYTAVYDSTSATVLGSVTHDFWKTGIDFRLGKTPGELETLSIYGGANTDDVCPHGAAAGSQINSPTIFIGFFADVREGLKEFGQANGAIAPPLSWKSGVPFGWMTFGALGADYTMSQMIAVSDFIHAHLQPAGFHDLRGSACIIFDGNRVYSDNAHIKAAVTHIHANDQQAGYYMSPFTYWRSGNDLHRKLAGSDITYAQIVLRDDRGRPIEHKSNSYVLDVTHPAVRKLIADQIDEAKRLGFDYFKLDFLTDGSLEGRHADPRVHSGIQAYNQAMQFIVDRIGPGKFISLSIAPVFPSQYGHSRRISCDIYSQLNDTTPNYRPFGSTQYLLNCATFDWWMGGTIYPFNDPDEMGTYRFHDAQPIPESWARARFTASIVCGGNIVDASNYADPAAARRVERILTNSAVDAVAREGLPFIPIFNERMDKDTTSMFYRVDGENRFLAVFNYDTGKKMRRVINSGAVHLSPDKAYTMHDLWSGRVLSTRQNQFEVDVPAGDAGLIQIIPDR
jgi:hypothetical protein